MKRIKILLTLYLSAILIGVAIANPNEDCKPAHIDDCSGDQSATEGQTVEFWIVAKGEPATFTYSWTHDGKPVGSNSARLKIVEVKAEDQGIYVCTVSNNCGTPAKSQEMELNTDCTDFDQDLVCGDEVKKISNSQYSVSGNVVAYDFLHFSNPVTVTNLHKLSGTGSIYLDGIPIVGQFSLYNGPINFEVYNGKFQIPAWISSEFELAGLDTYLKDFSIINGGVHVEGKFKIPKLFGGHEINIDPLEVTTNNISCKVFAEEVDFKFFTANDFSASFDLHEKSFGGSLELEIKNKFLKKRGVSGLGGGFEISNGRLESLNLSAKGALLIGQTGLMITEGEGEISGLSKNDVFLSLGCTIEPIMAFKVKPVVFEDVGLTFNWGKSLSVEGNMKLFNAQVMNVKAEATSRSLTLTGKLNLLDRYDACVQLGTSITNTLNVFGSIEGKLIILQNDLPFFKYDPIASIVLGDNPIFPLIYSTRAQFYNALINGGVSLNGYEITYSLDLASRPPNLSIGCNFTDLLASLNKSLVKINMGENNSCWRKQDENLKSLSLKEENMEPINIGSEIPLLIVSVKSNQKLPVISLLTPDNVVIDRNNFSTFPGVNLIEVPSDTIAIFTLKQPQKGNWYLKLPDDGVNYLISMLGQAEKPSIHIDSINSIGENQLKIKWSDYCKDDNALITLFYDNDNNNLDGALIVDSISEDNLCDEYQWNYSSIPDGQYYIYALISSKSGDYAYSYSKQPFTKYSSTELKAPSRFSAQTSDSSIVLSWEKVDMASQYLIYYSENSQVGLNSMHYVVMNDTTMFEYKSVKNGSSYQFFITSLDSILNESVPSDTLLIQVIHNQAKFYPIFIRDGYTDCAVVDSVYFIQLRCDYLGTDPLTFSGVHLPSGMSLSKDGNILWKPSGKQVGRDTLVARVANSFGLSDTITLGLNVVADANYLCNIQFDQMTYRCKEKAILSVQDLMRTGSSMFADTIQVKVITSIDTLLVQAIETLPNSKYYQAELELNSGLSTMGINLEATDTLLASYFCSYLNRSLSTTSRFEFKPSEKGKIISIDRSFIYKGDSIPFAVFGDYNPILWSNGSSNAVCQAKDEGQYFYFYEDENGCLVYSDTCELKIREPEFYLSKASSGRIKDLINIQLNAGYLINAGAITLFMNYDSTSLNYLGYEVVDNQFSNAIIYDDHGTIGIVCSSVNRGINLLDCKGIILLKFESRVKGSTSISFGNNCEVARYDGTVLPFNLAGLTFDIGTNCFLQYDSVSVTDQLTQGGTISIFASGFESSCLYSIVPDQWSGSNSFNQLKKGPYYLEIKTADDCRIAYPGNPVMIRNNPPVSVVSASLTVKEKKLLTLDGAKSYDIDGDTLNYLWTVPENISLINPFSSCPDLMAPSVLADSVIKVTLVVNDGEVNSTVAGCLVTVQQVTDSKNYLFQMPEITIFPNPTSGWVFVEISNSEQISQIELYSANGIKMNSFDCLGSKMKLDISYCTPGVYFVKVIGKHGFNVYRIVKKAQQ